MAFWLSVPLFGDLSFWVASVLFATRQFRLALIVGAIGLGLCATLYSFPLVASYVSRDPGATTGGLGAVLLRLTSIGLLVGFAWWFYSQERIDLPRKTDHRDAGFQPSETEQAWRDHTLLKVRKDAILPERCLKCNVPVEGSPFSRRFTWASPLWGCIILSVSPLLAGFVVFVVIYNILCWRGKITASLCPRHRTRAGLVMLCTWLTGLVGLLVLIAAANAPTNLQPILILLGCVTIFGAVPAMIFAARVLVPARMDKQFIWLKRVGSKYLATFPDWNV